MPVIAQRADALDGIISASLARRHWSGQSTSPISTTAIGFLVPIFVVLFFAPILCVFCVRRRRRSTAVPTKIRKPPPLDRDEARERLRAVTEVPKIARDQASTAQVEEKTTPDSVSILEKECAICLSTLHAPSPPDLAHLAQQPPSPPSPCETTATAAAPAKSLCTTDAEEILRLKVCAHEFHAECLVSWFVLRKTSCPICRAVYKVDDDADADADAEVPVDAEAQVPVPAQQQQQEMSGPSPPVAEQASNWHYFWTGRDRVLAMPRPGG